MAIDTESKRRSAYWGMGVWNVMPVPDGTVDAADRPHARWIYAGITITEITGRIHRRFAKGWQRIWFG